ncbi:hypothetical protein TUSST3_81340, partial [Streptomyces sp. TUS-ST3]
GRGVEG